MKIFRVALAALLVGASVPVLNAREINSNPAKQDAVSFHGGDPTCYSGGVVSGCEVAVDVTGNFLPTVSNAQTLGTASLPWSTVYAVSQISTGNETVGTAGVAGPSTTSIVGATAATTSSVLGLQVYGATSVGTSDANPGGVLVSTVIPVTSSFIRVIGNGSTTITAKPNISTTTVIAGGASLEIPDGTLLMITSSATVTDQVVFQSSGTLSGSQLRLGSTTRAVYVGRILTLIYDRLTHCWLEQNYE